MLLYDLEGLIVEVHHSVSTNMHVPALVIPCQRICMLRCGK